MTALLALLGRLWPYLLPLVLGVWLGYLATHKVEHGEVTRAQNALSSYKAQTEANAARAKADGEAKTAELQASADAAHQAFLEEQSDNAHYRSTHPDAPVRLYLAASNDPGGRNTAKAGQGAAGATQGDVRPVPDADPGVRPGAGPDISGLLRRFAARADAVSAQLRECQAR